MRNQLFAIGIALALYCPAASGEEVGMRLAATRDDTKVSLVAREQATLVDIVSPWGIDSATLTRTGKRWPDSIVICLHVKGLELFSVASGKVGIEATVPSTGEPLPRLSLRQNGAETALDKTSPYWTDVRLVGGKGKIPLENGHFEISLPAKLFEGNPESIQLRWIDFYRN